MHEVRDNKALSSASAQAVKDGIPLLALFILSPQDYIAHDRSARRIDFTLRNLQVIKVSPHVLLQDVQTQTHFLLGHPREAAHPAPYHQSRSANHPPTACSLSPR